MDCGGLASVEGEMKEGGGEGGYEDHGARDLVIWGFGLEQEEGGSGEKREDEGGGERMKIGAIERDIGGGTELRTEKI